MFDAVDGLLEKAVADGVVPGVAICVRDRERVLYKKGFGSAELRPRPRSASGDTVWDLASLTKVLAATPIAMTMVARNEFTLETPVHEFLPHAPTGITMGHLLSHSSGATAWVPFADRFGVEQAGTAAMRRRILAAAVSEPLDAEPGSTYRYSDVGFLMLCAAMETVAGTGLAELYEDRVARPSGVGLFWGRADAAATEDCPVRKRVIRGEVHDLNAWLMGGVSTHAGLFGTVESVAANTAWQLRALDGCDSEGLDPHVVRMFVERSGAGSHRMGWDGVSEGGSAGPHWPRNGLGHLAFTGCSVWMAPEEGIVVAMASNRIHPVIEGGAIPNAPIDPRYAAFRAMRPDVHSAVARALGLALKRR